MNKKVISRLMVLGIIVIGVSSNSLIFANNKADANINIEKRNVTLGDSSRISIKLDENISADKIILEYVCYDKSLDAVLTYNESTNSYEGEIEFNQDPEYLNTWELNQIEVYYKSGEKQVVDNMQLIDLGVNLDSFKINQKIKDFEGNIPYKFFKSSTQSTVSVNNIVGSDRYETATMISQEGWPNGSNTVIIVSGEGVADGISATPLATLNDAPILLTSKSGLSSFTKDEILRLNPSRIIIIGGDEVMPNNVVDQIKSISNGAKIDRIQGQDRYETSLNIAKEIDANKDVDKVYMSHGYAEGDALSIAAKAGQDQSPIILINKHEVNKEAYDWLKGESLKTAYFIGGPDVIYTNVIDMMNTITYESVYQNRVYGSDRHETNAKVIEKFFSEGNLNSVMVTNSELFFDALTAGPLAAKFNSPVIITPENYLSKYHEENLEKKTADKVYKMGGKVSDSVVSEVASKLSYKPKTVVIDAGHGGTDPGASNPIDRSIQEKNYVLDVSIATANYLSNNGVDVILTRDVDKTMSLSERTSLSNQVKPEMFASIHYNSFNTTASGTEVYYSAKDRNGGPSKTAATNVLNSIMEYFPLKNRGIKYKTLDDGVQDYYYVIRNNEADSILIECSFIDNEDDIRLNDESYERENMGEAIGVGILNSLK